jgi:hypothetical protein
MPHLVVYFVFLNENILGDKKDEIRKKEFPVRPEKNDFFATTKIGRPEFCFF